MLFYSANEDVVLSQDSDENPNNAKMVKEICGSQNYPVVVKSCYEPPVTRASQKMSTSVQFSEIVGTAKPNVVMTSHCDGEVWGLDVVDIGNGQMRMITSGDDNRILTYNLETH